MEINELIKTTVGTNYVYGETSSVNEYLDYMNEMREMKKQVFSKMWLDKCQKEIDVTKYILSKIT